MDRDDFRHQELWNAALLALASGGTITRGISQTSTLYRILVRGDSATIPAGIVLELLRNGLVTEKHYPDSIVYFLSAKGKARAQALATAN